MKWTIQQAANEWQINRKTLASRLRKAGHRFGAGQSKTFTTLEIVDAVVPPLLRERIRETRERADKLAIDNASARRDQVPMSEAYKAIDAVVVPLRTELQSLPSTLAGRLNPSDPELARTALEDALRRITDTMGVRGKHEGRS